MRWIEAVMTNLHEWEWVGILLARLAVGLLFALSGGGKLFVEERREKMKKTLREAAIPFPEANAWFVAAVELIFGVFLVLGLLTPLTCLMLIAVMVVAILTVKLGTIEADSVYGWLSELLYIPDVLYLVILVWLLFAGPVWLSLDHFLR